MKKFGVVLALMIVMPVFAANEGYNTYTDEGYYTTRTVKKPASYKKTTASRKNGGYTNTIQNNFYSSYPQPVRASSYDVQTSPRHNYSKSTYYSSNYDYDNFYGTKEKQVRTVNKSYSTQERKFFLAHPFFQPLKGRFGSVTDVSYATNNFKFDVLNGEVLDIDPGSATYNTTIVPFGTVDLRGKQESTQIAVKEDFSFGLSDTLAIIGMLQYDRTEVSLDNWSDGSSGAKTKDSGLNIFGIGIQSRFIDNHDWIAMVSGYYQHQRDVANTFIGELRIGYKINRTTLYGLARAGYSNLIDGDIYGAYVKDKTGDWMMLSYKTDVNNIIYVEGGMGVFAVLNKYFTLNSELIYGHYDWHEQLNIKGALGWQPGDMFALNLYASTSLYDSAKNKTNKYFQYDVNPEIPGSSSTLVYTTGDYKIKNYNEWKIGLQAILYF